jgi:hypothetical protein
VSFDKSDTLLDKNTKLTLENKRTKEMKLNVLNADTVASSRDPPIELRTDFIPNRGTSNLHRENDPMATVDDVESIIYPAFCFKASPTHFTWVKMAIADVHRLQKPRNFDGKDAHISLFLAFINIAVTAFCYQRGVSIPTVHPDYQDPQSAKVTPDSHIYC